MSEISQTEDPLVAQWFENHYICPLCDTEWYDEWSCTCNDRCPTCDAEIEVTDSVDLSRPLNEEDYVGAARLIKGDPSATALEATAQDAREYAEAMLEGGEYRFRPELFTKRSLTHVTIIPVERSR